MLGRKMARLMRTPGPACTSAEWFPDCGMMLKPCRNGVEPRRTVSKRREQNSIVRLLPFERQDDSGLHRCFSTAHGTWAAITPLHCPLPFASHPESNVPTWYGEWHGTSTVSIVYRSVLRLRTSLRSLCSFMLAGTGPEGDGGLHCAGSGLRGDLPNGRRLHGARK